MIKNAKFCSGFKVVPWIKIFVLPDFWKVAQRKLDFKVLSNFCSCTMKKIHNWSVVDFHVFVKLRVLVIFNLNCIIMYYLQNGHYSNDLLTTGTFKNSFVIRYQTFIYNLNTINVWKSFLMISFLFSQKENVYKIVGYWICA